MRISSRRAPSLNRRPAVFALLVMLSTLPAGLRAAPGGKVL